ncbi:DUF1015 domain-containing protein [Nocardioides panacis]|uniref:DUF1015 domain-containing protein n=1 Tax=Nocardioides panacis TaxID=2849501 RepID=A0A975T204_9ACTN|nr:DUF1015 domain-containing protein [Nocardioides panacis]QWZ10198.1 DUF1015 domain-containing protein [Nocardioides panacis]
MVSDAHPTPPPGTGDRRPFTLSAFRGLRFDPATVGDLGTVISPPYDVLDADTVRDLEATNRRNIVRLILSRRFERPYLAVRARLLKWREKGYLRADDDPALYLYEYVADGTTVRGLIGLAGLRTEDERVILPHEDVMPGPVDDRTVLMRTTETNLEPILLVHEGTERLRALISDAAVDDPSAQFVALDGSVHRLWAVADPAVVDAIGVELAGTQALIADGHHRYAAYLRLQAELRDPDAPDGTSPWDSGLALLVDQRDHPLHIGPIHRSVGALTMADVSEISADRDDDFATFPDREAAFAALVPATAEQSADSVAFVVSDGRAWAVLRTKRTSPVDASVLHEVLLPAWGVAEEQIGYHHSLDQALHTTARQPGIVVAVHPPTVAQVMETAAAGVRMPRKSTSFAPKPRMGVVMRDLHDA